jgi:hypothetical protein
MERKTNIHAEDGKQEIMITREFDLPLELLFKAYEEPEIIEQWMGTKVLKLENKNTVLTNLKPPISKETSMGSMGQYMNLFPTKRSRGLLKWKMRLWRST